MYTEVVGATLSGGFRVRSVKLVCNISNSGSSIKWSAVVLIPSDNSKVATFYFYSLDVIPGQIGHLFINITANGIQITPKIQINLLSVVLRCTASNNFVKKFVHDILSNLSKR